jgi:hypothetical protein
VLFTDKDETKLSREDLQGSNIAMEVTFSPRAMPESASIVWFLGADLSAGEMFTFDYFPASGSWAIMKAEGQAWSMIASGWAQATPKDTTSTIMVFINGNRISAFQDGIFLGSVVTDRPKTGIDNLLSVRSKGAPHAQVDILKIGFWNLDAVEWTTDDWITARPETVLIDSFTGKEGLKFSPVENEKYEDGRSALYTDGGETGLSRDDLQGENVALEVSFIPRNMPDSNYLVWFIGQDTTSKNRLEFNYQPKNGSWQICKVENEQWQMLSSGIAQPTPDGSAATIMVVADGNQVRAFLNRNYIGSVAIDRSGAGTWNELVIRNKEKLFARVDIFKIRFWNLDKTMLMSSETINARTPKFMAEKFQANEGWQFNPVENEKYQDDKAVLFSNGGETYLTNNEFTGSNIAMEVTFIPQDMPDSAYLMWYLKGVSGDLFAFEYSPATGYWSLFKNENQGLSKIKTAQTQPTPVGKLGKIMIVMNKGMVSAYYLDTFLGSIEGSPPDTVTTSVLSVRNIHDALFVQVDIVKIRFWNLDEAEWMSIYWITSHPITFMEDIFKSGDGWKFSPMENEKYQDNMAVLYTNGGETGLMRNEIQGTNCALAAHFIPRDMPDSASLVWFIRKNTTTGDMFSFEYFPGTGAWQIVKVENQVLNKLASGITQSNLKGTVMGIMVVEEGDRVSAFIGNTYLGSAESSLAGAGNWNELVIRSNLFAQVDIVELVYWNLDR